MDECLEKHPYLTESEFTVAILEGNFVGQSWAEVWPEMIKTKTKAERKELPEVRMPGHPRKGQEDTLSLYKVSQGSPIEDMSKVQVKILPQEEGVEMSEAQDQGTEMIQIQ